VQADEAGGRVLPRQVARHRAVQLLQGLLRRQRGAQARAQQQRGADGQQQGELLRTAHVLRIMTAAWPGVVTHVSSSVTAFVSVWNSMSRKAMCSRYLRPYCAPERLMLGMQGKMLETIIAVSTIAVTPRLKFPCPRCRACRRRSAPSARSRRTPPSSTATR